MNLDVRVELFPEPVIANALAMEQPWRNMGIRMWQRSRDLAPVGEEGGGALRDSMTLRFGFGADPRIEVGSKHTVGKDQLALLGLVEEGTQPHPIDPIPPNQVLVFKAHGQLVFAAHVDHPGTRPNRFVERAMQQIIHESLGLSLVHV